MKARQITAGVKLLGAIDWDRRLFDSLIPLPDGTTYNAYLIEGSEKTVLIDSVDPSMTEILLDQLQDVRQIDYVVSNHAEKDHSGAMPAILEKYPDATLLASKPAIEVLMDSLNIQAERIEAVADGHILNLGDKTLEFIYTPWVHWPETMVTYLQEEGILFSCDFFGSHIASSETYVTDKGRVLEAAKRYFGEIMQPFRAPIRGNLKKLAPYNIQMVAPSHGPIYKEPTFIFEAYKDWASEDSKNLVVVPYVSMHGGTRKMVDCLVDALVDKNLRVERFDLQDTDIGKLATALVDASTIVIGTPTVLGGPHPSAAYAALLANALRPKAKFLSVLATYGWGGKAVETLASLVPNLNVDILTPVLVKGSPSADTFREIDELAAAIADKHSKLLNEDNN